MAWCKYSRLSVAMRTSHTCHSADSEQLKRNHPVRVLGLEVRFLVCLTQHTHLVIHMHCFVTKISIRVLRLLSFIVRNHSRLFHSHQPEIQATHFELVSDKLGLHKVDLSHTKLPWTTEKPRVGLMVVLSLFFAAGTVLISVMIC